MSKVEFMITYTQDGLPRLFIVRHILMDTDGCYLLKFRSYIVSMLDLDLLGLEAFLQTVPVAANRFKNVFKTKDA